MSYYITKVQKLSVCFCVLRKSTQSINYFLKFFHKISPSLRVTKSNREWERGLWSGNFLLVERRRKGKKYIKYVALSDYNNSKRYTLLLLSKFRNYKHTHKHKRVDPWRDSCVVVHTLKVVSSRCFSSLNLNTVNRKQETQTGLNFLSHCTHTRTYVWTQKVT